MPKRRKVTINSGLINDGLRGQIFRELSENLKVSDNKNVWWSHRFEVEEYVSVLQDAFSFPSELSERETAQILAKELISVRSKGPLSDSSVLEALQRSADARLSEPKQQYAMWSRISFRPPSDYRDKIFKYKDVTINLKSNLPNYMNIDDKILNNLTPIHKKDMEGFGYVSCRTLARNDFNAADKIFRSCEIFQSVFNLFSKSRNWFGTENRPEANLLMGPYHFLYRNRSRISGVTWYNENFRAENWDYVTSNSEYIENLSSVVRRALRVLEHHPLKDALSSAFLMMNEGMEAGEMSRRTLRYWTALEKIFQNSDGRLSYKDLIRRATYLDDPGDLVRAKLNRLARIRNRYVHVGLPDHHHHQLTQFFADFIARHLFYLLFNGDDFSDHAEFIAMTDLPSNRSALERQRRAIDRRERMIENRRHRAD